MISNCLFVKNLSHGFKGELLFKDLTYDFKREGLYVLTGENGVGKSTLLNMLGGFLSPARGELGGDAFNKNDTRTFYGDPFLYPLLTVEENFEIFLKSDFEKVLIEFGLDKVRQKLVSELSRGYVQRVCLAVVLGREAKVYLLDEPSSFLDEKGKSYLNERINSLIAIKATIILSTHEPSLFLNSSKEILRIANGGLESV